jgi:hypothetical protein
VRAYGLLFSTWTLGMVAGALVAVLDDVADPEVLTQEEDLGRRGAVRNSSDTNTTPSTGASTRSRNR